METHFAPKATETKRGTTSKSKQRQQIVHQQEIVHLSIVAPLRDQSNSYKSYIEALGHHFETKATTTTNSYISALKHHFET